MGKAFERLVLFFAVFVVMFSFVQTAHPSSLTLTIASNNSYNLGENIITNGTLSSGGSPVPDGLVSVQVNKPTGDDPADLFLMRTLNTGSQPSGPWSVEILEAYACDVNGHLVSSFQRGGAGGFKVTVKNNDASLQSVMAVLSICDSSGIPFKTLLMISQTLEPYQTISKHSWIEEVIPSDAATGTAHVYAVALTNWPQSGGAAWCPETSSNFTITLSGGGSGATIDENPKTSASLSTAPGNFSLPFKISSNGGLLGNYTIHATSWYNNTLASSQKTFEAVLIADVSKDKVVDMLDLSIIIDAFMTTPGSPNWNPSADIKKDNSVDMSDISIAVDEFLRWGR